MYSLGIFAYALLVRIAAFFGHKKARRMVDGQRETWKKLRAEIDPTARYIWIHAASLGEFEQGRPIIERLRRESPSQKILLTFFSPSGYEVRKNYPHADLICYLPFDTPWAAWKFVRRVRPEMLILIKYEFWRNYIHRLAARNIPIYSVSSIFRQQQVYFRWYGGGFAKALRRVSHFFVQNEESQRLLATLNIVGNVSVVGDTRFDRVIDVCRDATDLPHIERFRDGRPLIVAGSTWQPDEALLLQHAERFKEVQLIVAPHEVSQERLNEIEHKFKGSTLRYSQLLNGEAQSADLLLIDSYGLLSSLYRYATIAYVGGGFGAGIHNVPEAAVYGIPVIIGPRHKRFVEATTLIAKGGCLPISKQKELDNTLKALLENPDQREAAGKACYEYIHRNAGATEAFFRRVFPNLSPLPSEGEIAMSEAQTANPEVQTANPEAQTANPEAQTANPDA